MEDIANLIATDQIQVEVTIRLGGTQLSVAELARLRPNDILTLDQDMTDGVDICVGDKVIARGEQALILVPEIALTPQLEGRVDRKSVV